MIKKAREIKIRVGIPLSRQVAIAVVCGLFLILSLFEAGLSAHKVATNVSVTTERWFESDAFVEAARERKLASTRQAPNDSEETGSIGR
jgi:hypothetical protein